MVCRTRSPDGPKISSKEIMKRTVLASEHQSNSLALYRWRPHQSQVHVRARCSQTQPCSNDFADPDIKDDGRCLIWQQFSRGRRCRPCGVPGMPAQPQPLGRSLAAAALVTEPPSAVTGTAAGSVSGGQHRLNVLHFRRVSC